MDSLAATVQEMRSLLKEGSASFRKERKVGSENNASVGVPASEMPWKRSAQRDEGELTSRRFAAHQINKKRRCGA